MDNSIRKAKAAVNAAKKARAEWIAFFGSRRTRGLALLELRLERAQIAHCRAQSRAAVREMFG